MGCRCEQIWSRQDSTPMAPTAGRLHLSASLNLPLLSSKAMGNGSESLLRGAILAHIYSS